MRRKARRHTGNAEYRRIRANARPKGRLEASPSSASGLTPGLRNRAQGQDLGLDAEDPVNTVS